MGAPYAKVIRPLVNFEFAHESMPPASNILDRREIRSYDLGFVQCELE
jgi:hypothetical protein